MPIEILNNSKGKKIGPAQNLYAILSTLTEIIT